MKVGMNIKAEISVNVSESEKKKYFILNYKA